MKRREFFKLLGGAAAWPSIALAQQTRVGLPLIGALWPGKPSAPITGSLLQAFREGLREVGFVEGQNVTTEHRYAEGPVGLEKAANDLAGLNVKVILAVGTPAVLAARRATTTIPIVGASMADPVADGSVASLARPGGKVTGNTFLGPELMPKRLQLLREIVPRADRIAALVHSGVYGEATMRNMQVGIEEAAKASGVGLRIFGVSGPNEFDGAFAAIVAAQAGALIILPSPMFYLNHHRLVDLAASNKLPTMYVFREASGSWRLDLLRARHSRSFASRGRIRGQDSQGRRTQRSTCRGAGQVRVCYQPQNCQGARPDDPNIATVERGPDHRIIGHPDNEGHPVRFGSSASQPCRRHVRCCFDRYRIAA